jgi:hypothetical protein
MWNKVVNGPLGPQEIDGVEGAYSYVPYYGDGEPSDPVPVAGDQWYWLWWSVDFGWVCNSEPAGPMPDFDPTS